MNWSGPLEVLVGPLGLLVGPLGLLVGPQESAFGPIESLKSTLKISFLVLVGPLRKKFTGNLPVAIHAIPTLVGTICEY